MSHVTDYWNDNPKPIGNKIFCVKRGRFLLSFLLSMYKLHLEKNNICGAMIFSIPVYILSGFDTSKADRIAFVKKKNNEKDFLSIEFCFLLIQNHVLNFFTLPKTTSNP